MDLDQGGIFREWKNVYLGPSIGWVPCPQLNLLPVTAGGTYILDVSFSNVNVNTTGAVTITLPSTLNPPVGAQPGLSVDPPIVIADTGGNAAAHPITIIPAAGDTIMGLSSIQIVSNYGSYVFIPNSVQRNWTAK
jgi:hypothetical protein